MKVAGTKLPEHDAIKSTKAITMPIEKFLPNREGWLPVHALHRLYYAEYGVPDAPAILVLHGGPGSGCRPSMLNLFDLSRHRVILFDQRGAGKSTPYGEVTANNTAALIEDIEYLRHYLRIPCWQVVGGSWGATLALCYAGQYPHVLTGLILRAVFLASQREVDWFFQSLRLLVPDQWARLTAGLATPQKGAVFQFLATLLNSVSHSEQHEAARRWGNTRKA
jgi:proline iminopeptidase